MRKFEKIQPRTSFPPINIPGMAVYSEKETQSEKEMLCNFLPSELWKYGHLCGCPGTCKQPERPWNSPMHCKAVQETLCNCLARSLHSGNFYGVQRALHHSVQSPAISFSLTESQVSQHHLLQRSSRLHTS